MGWLCNFQVEIHGLFDIVMVIVSILWNFEDEIPNCSTTHLFDKVSEYKDKITCHN
jgi:hypothetical protein